MIKSLLAAEQEVGGEFKGLGPLANFTNIAEAVNLFNRVMSLIIGFLTVVAGLWFVFLFITGGIAWLTAGGDKMATENAQKKITTGIIGLTIVVAGIFLIDLIGSLLGLEILSPGKFVLNIWK